MTHLHDPLWSHAAPLPSMTVHKHQSEVSGLPSTSQHTSTTITSLSPTSVLNPFFGYPVSSCQGSSFLPHGRRRKRDLARTLALLFWIRWRKHIVIGVLLAVCAFAVRSAIRRKQLHVPSMVLQGKIFWSSTLNHRRTIG